MARRKMQKGICRICKRNTDLSYEHIPPKSAFNKYTKFKTIPLLEYIKRSEESDFYLKGKTHQGGIGYYCLCRDCNSFLGNNYVPEYHKMAVICNSILRTNKNFEKIIFEVKEISPLRFLKQILSMFVCLNDSKFTDQQTDLLKFIKDPKENNLPDNIRVFMYLNNIGEIRNLTNMYSNHYGFVNEFTFPPFGFVLSLSPEFSFPLNEITQLKDYDIDYRDSIKFELLKQETHLPFPIDYRTLKEIEQQSKNT